jgi:hypothetical protein
VSPVIVRFTVFPEADRDKLVEQCIAESFALILRERLNAKKVK